MQQQNSLNINAANLITDRQTDRPTGLLPKINEAAIGRGSHIRTVTAFCLMKIFMSDAFYRIWNVQTR